MDYSIQELAALTGVTSRTLRWYDRIGLLKACRLDNGYRCYGSAEVDRLQQILFYRELGVELEQIRRILDDPAFDPSTALRQHLEALLRQQERVRGLIHTVERTLQSLERKCPMSDKEKFEAFKRQAVEENEARYGAEIRRKYGDEAVDASNARMMHMTPEQYQLWKELDAMILERLDRAVSGGADPEGEEGREIALLHKRWLSVCGAAYSPAYHRGLAELYTADERFTAYYDKNRPGCADFLRRAVLCWIKEA